MRETAYFLINNPAILGAGKQDSYSLLLTTRCRLRKKSGNRNLSFGLIEDSQSYEMICRFQSSLEDNLRVDVKIIIGTFLYTIGTWETIDNINHLYKFSLNVEKQYAKNSNPISDYVIGATLFTTLLYNQTSVQDDLLKSSPGHTVTVLWVSREGTVLQIGVAANLVAHHDSITGIVSFDPLNPGNLGGEKIVVAYNVS